MKRWIACGIAVLLTPLCSWAQYRCVENGKTVFTDRPCSTESAVPSTSGGSPKVIGAKANTAYSTGYGDWRGQLQYQASLNGQPVSEAHAIVQTTVSIDPQGKIVGMSPENGSKPQNTKFVTFLGA